MEIMNFYEGSGGMLSEVTFAEDERAVGCMEQAGEQFGITVTAYPNDTPEQRQMAAEVYAQYNADLRGKLGIVGIPTEAARGLAISLQEVGRYVVRWTAQREPDQPMPDISGFFMAFTNCYGIPQSPEQWGDHRRGG